MNSWYDYWDTLWYSELMNLYHDSLLYEDYYYAALLDNYIFCEFENRNY